MDILPRPTPKSCDQWPIDADDRADQIEVVVCIATFRRPEGLAATLRSLRALRSAFAFAIVVIENDPIGRRGLAAARQFFAESGLAGVVLVEDRPGNCRAINAAFEAALTQYKEAQYFAMIDDDETASPGWLQALFSSARSFAADIVGGPVFRHFEGSPTAGVRGHPVFGSIEAPTGRVPIIHGSGNCMIARRVFERMPKPAFDLRFNYLGGGDMDFFTRCKREGFSFAWCQEAAIFETVPMTRTTPAWIFARSVRIGVINYHIDCNSAFAGARLALIAKNFATMPLAVIRAARLLLTGRQLLPSTHPVLVSFGRHLASLGFFPAAYKN